MRAWWRRWRRNREWAKRRKLVRHPETFEEALVQYVYWTYALVAPRDRQVAHWECSGGVVLDLARIPQRGFLERVPPDLALYLLGRPLVTGDGLGGFGGWPVLVTEVRGGGTAAGLSRAGVR